jgi:hypothetical protein
MGNNKYLMSMAIPMETFLNDFVFANGYERAVDTKTGQVINLRLLDDLSHYDVDDLAFEGVKRAPWSEVTQDAVLRGQILLVRAGSWKHNYGSIIIPYYRPQLVLGDGYAAAMQKDFSQREESMPLPSSYTLRRWKKQGKRNNK